MAPLDHDFAEQVAQFGPGRGLVGVVTEPRELEKKKTAVVILNTGTIHRVGHHRMYVTMARRLAACGNTVLRFDFSGIGDSARGSSPQALIESNLSDLRQALDWLERKYEVSAVVLVGLCAGADYAVLYGHSDPRVIGLVLIDPYIPATARYFRDYIVKRLLDLDSWRNFNFRNSKIVNRVSELFSSPSRVAAPLHPIAGDNIRKSLEKIYHATVEARIRLLVVCTGADYAPRQTYREQFTSAFRAVPFEDLLRLEYFEDADHTFRSPNSRSELTRVIEDWLKMSNFDRVSHSASVRAPEGSLVSP